MGRVPLILNGQARGIDQRTIARVRQSFEQAGVDVDLQVVRGAELEPAIRALAEAGAVAVGGGDGTHSTAAALLVGTGTTLIPVPVGTLNHFARRLGIDSAEAAARAVNKGHPMRVPVGSVNGRAFINNVNLGVYPRLVRTRERLRPRIGYLFANAVAGLHALWRLRTVTINIEACGRERDRAIAGIWIGLGRGSFRLPDDAEPIAARTLEIVIAPGRTRARLVADAIRTVATLRRGNPPHQAGLETFHAPVVKLRCAGLLDLARDGEAERVTPPVTLLVLEGALEVMSLEPMRAADPPIPCPEPEEPAMTPGG
ncbi:MAG TPA: diacylglycerol kinase family protein [Gemmatimonadales bacterium]|jgi:undecaprenyl-diphosphatase|nr:diacylglycerol kinase family protein [Gemmatimonadales bacterium]